LNPFLVGLTLLLKIHYTTIDYWCACQEINIPYSIPWPKHASRLALKTRILRAKKTIPSLMTCNIWFYLVNLAAEIPFLRRSNNYIML